MKSLSFLALASLAPCVLAADWTVTPGGSIQAAIDSASSGDTITIDPGTYVENLVIDGKQLQLRASLLPGTVVIDGSALGAVIHALNAADVKLEQLTVTNGAGTRGGGLLFENAVLELVDCVIHTNSVTLDGGGIWCNLAGTRIETSVIRDNHADDRGGGAYLAGGAPQIRDSAIHDNYALDGGGLYLSGNGALIEGNEIYHNDGLVGVGVWSSNLGAVFRNNYIHHNGDAFAWDGSGIYCTGDDAFFVNNEFYSNFSDFDGVAVWCSGNRLLFQGNLYHRNIGGRAYGSIRALGDDVEFYGEVVDDNSGEWHAVYCTGERTLLVGCQVTDNYGGGIQVRGSANISDCLVTGNASGWYESGVDFYDGIGGSLRRSIVLDNHADKHTGGVGIVNSQVELSDVVVGWNTGRPASLYGAGVYVEESMVLLERCTLAHNRAYGGNPPGLGIGLYVIGAASSVLLTDSIVWGNEDGAGGSSEIHVAAGSLVVSYSDVRGGWPGIGNINVDPLFVNAAGWDLRLNAGSPCIDKADPIAAASGTDPFGQPRLLDGDLDRAMRLDMGAYEYGNARLGVTGAPAPGATLNIAIETDLPLVGMVLVGELPGESFLPPFGSLLFDPLGPWSLGTAILTLPHSFPVTVPGGFTTPRTVIFQALAIDLANGAGNLSNAVQLDFP